jgi:hypothetical protein
MLSVVVLYGILLNVVGPYKVHLHYGENCAKLVSMNKENEIFFIYKTL